MSNTLKGKLRLGPDAWVEYNRGTERLSLNVGGVEQFGIAAGALLAPGNQASTAGFDKVLKISVGGTPYYVPLIDNNST